MLYILLLSGVTGMRSTAVTLWKSFRVSSCGRSPRPRRTSPGCCAIAGGSCRCLTCAGSCTASLARPVSSTRIVLVHYPDENGLSHILGLMVERVTDTLTSHEVTFAPTGITTEDAPYLGDMATDAHGMIHRLRVEALLPAPMRIALLSQPGA